MEGETAQLPGVLPVAATLKVSYLEFLGFFFSRVYERVHPSMGGGGVDPGGRGNGDLNG